MSGASALDARVGAAEQVVRAGVAAGIGSCAALEIGTAEGVPRRIVAGRLGTAPAAAPADADTIFDLASLTKVLATTLLAMRLEDAGRCAMTDRVTSWWPAWYGPGR